MQQRNSKSLKSQTRQSGGRGHRIVVNPGVKILGNFNPFLTKHRNKEELFSMLANIIVGIDGPS